MGRELWAGIVASLRSVVIVVVVFYHQGHGQGLEIHVCGSIGESVGEWLHQ